MESGLTPSAQNAPRLRRVLRLRDLILYGMIVIQPTAPMPAYGLMSQRAHGHAVTAVLLAMVAMLFTAISYGRMARIYPSAGSAFTYVGREIHPVFGYVTGWSMVIDYVLNPIVCTILCSKFALNFVPEIPFLVCIVLFASLFTTLNLFAIQTSARINGLLAAAMGIVIIIFLFVALRYVMHSPADGADVLLRPFYDPHTFSTSAVLSGTSIAVLTYIGFDGISTLAEEAENPKRNILWATVLVCLITGVLASVEVYAAQLIWPASLPFPDVDTAFVHVAGRAGGPWLFALINVTLLVATVGSGMGSQLGAARLLYAMGRAGALPTAFFGAIEPRRGIPRNNVLLVGAVALIGACVLSFERAVEVLNFGALLAFMGVNCAAVRHYVRTRNGSVWAGVVPSALGFVVCALLWLSLSPSAKWVGVAWMLVGVIYGAIKTRGFRKSLIKLEIPEEAREAVASPAGTAAACQR